MAAKEVKFGISGRNKMLDGVNTLALVLDDLSHDEAAEVLGVAPGTVSWRISEAKKRLRAQREKEDQA